MTVEQLQLEVFSATHGKKELSARAVAKEMNDAKGPVIVNKSMDKTSSDILRKMTSASKINLGQGSFLS